MKKDTLDVLGITGSLRQGSYNTAALRAAAELAPEGMVIEPFELHAIPLYNEDIREKGYPDAVEKFRSRVRQADAILIVTPEYNYSIPGVLKNAIDWASRPPEQPFENKPLAIMGASLSQLGTARAQYHLRQVFIYLNAHLLNQPEVMIGSAAEKFDRDGRLTDEKTRKHIAKQLTALRDWTYRLQEK